MNGSSSENYPKDNHTKIKELGKRRTKKSASKSCTQKKEGGKKKKKQKKNKNKKTLKKQSKWYVFVKQVCFSYGESPRTPPLEGTSLHRRNISVERPWGILSLFTASLPLCVKSSHQSRCHASPTLKKKKKKKNQNQKEEKRGRRRPPPPPKKKKPQEN